MIRDLTKHSVGRVILTLSSPIFCSMIIGSLWLSIDVWFLGMIGEDKIALIAYITPCLIIIYALIDGLGIPLTVLTGQHVGASNSLECARVRNNGFLLIFGLSCLLSILGYVFLPVFGRSLSIDSVSLQRDFSIYSTCFVITLIPWCIRAYQGSICAGSGCTLPSYISSSVFIGFKFLFQFLGWHYGYLSVLLIGSSTILAMWLSVIITGFYIKHIGIRVMPSLKPGVSIDTIKQIFIVALPVMAGNGLGSIEAAITLAFLKDYGPKVLAALSLIERFRTTALFPAISIGVGLSIFISHHYGAKNFERAWEGIKWSSKSLGLGYLVLTLVSFIFVKPILLLFAPTADVARDLAYQIISAELICYPFLALGFVGQGAFEGTGKTYPNLITMILVVLFGRLLPYIFILPKLGPVGLKYILPWSHMLHVFQTIWFVLFFSKFRVGKKQTSDQLGLAPIYMK